jgi:signal transduction histidine kinase
VKSRSDRVVSIDHSRLDAALAIAILAELELEVWLDRGIRDSHRPLTAVAAALLVVPVAFRRRWPAGALVCCAAVAAIEELLGGSLIATSGLGFMLTFVLLVYTAGARLELRRGLVALTLALCGFFFPSNSGSDGVATSLFLAGLVFAAPWFVGRLARERNRRAVAFRALALQASAERGQRKLAAIAQERVRIGREVQDIITHNVTAMVIQAGGARQLLRIDPERARNSILSVEQTGREALGDLRRVLGMLRKDEDPVALAPQPGLDQLPALLDTMRTAGLECDLQLVGEPSELTPGVDLVGYRVIEAALHAVSISGCRHAAVTVRHRLGDLELEIRSDDSVGDLDSALGGISERVALYGGSLRVAPADGFAFHAHLPLAVAATA